MPTSLTATKIKDTYGQLLHVDGGVTSTPKLVYDGDGTATALSVSTLGAVFETNSTSDALRITQTGAGNALLVEDSANPDSTPFVIDASGTLLAGLYTAPAGGYKAVISGSALASSSLRVGDISDGTTSGYIGNVSNATKSLALVADPDNVGANSIIRIDIDGSTKLTVTHLGSMVLGGTVANQISFYNRRDITGSTTSYANHSNGTVQSDVTGTAYAYSTDLGTAAASFTLGNLKHFSASQATFGAGSTVTNQFGFTAEADLTGATNNYGFYSAIASGTGRWNFYAPGTAANYFAGETTVNSGFTIGRTAVTAPAASDGNVFSGTYTPTITNGTNVASSTAYSCQYMRVGNVVTITGYFAVALTAANTSSLIDISLPIASAFSGSRQAAGTAVYASSTVANSGYGAISSEATNDRIQIRFSDGLATTSHQYQFTATYQVV